MTSPTNPGARPPRRTTATPGRPLLLPALLAVLIIVPPAAGQHDVHAGHAHAVHGLDQAVHARRDRPWSEATLERAAALPLQDGGRIKPLSTFAGFTLLRLNGKRSVVTPDGERLGPTAWLLDVLFFPGAASGYEHFLVSNDEVVAAMGLRFDDKRKSDRYALDDLRPGLDRLFTLAGEYHRLPEAERTNVQQQIVVLASNVDTFLDLTAELAFARARVPLPDAPAIAELFGGASEVPFSTVLGRVGPLRALYEGDSREAALPVLSAAATLSSARTLAIVPPVLPRNERLDWSAPGEFFDRAYDGEDIAPAHAEILALIEELPARLGQPAAFEAGLGELLSASRALAEARGEYETVPLEITYYRADLIYNSLVTFVLAFLLSAVLWLRPRSRVVYGLAMAAAGLATVLLVAAIVMRCLIRGRPPVSTLYETLLFVAAVGCAIGLVVEWINRRRIALSAAVVLGMIGLFLANGYERLDKQDTMPSLVAVLDTNFWLATHVTAITAGYAAGMLSALLASLYLLLKLLGFRSGERRFYSGLSRMVYGVLAFAVIFSTVGTILGGIWANDSWGRFWGWDPKENGALLIVISQLVILHARMGGYLREHGVCMAAAFSGTVIAFSWFGVNLLGVGLHSYGFTSGIHTALWTYYLVQWGIVALGGLAWMRAERRVTSRATAPRPMTASADAVAGDTQTA